MNKQLIQNLLALLALIGATHLLADDLVIKNVTVIDAVSGVRENQSIFIQSGQIQKVGAAAAADTAAQTIDGTGKYLIPGLWDMHVHIVYEQALIEAMPGLFLDYGITSVRDTGALLHKIAPQIERWQQLEHEAPDIFFSGPLLDGRLVVYDGNGRTEIGVSNPDSRVARENVAVLKEAGASFIKIYELVSPEVFQTLASAADEAGMPIAAHVPLSMLAQTAGPKVGTMEHLRNIEIACADNADELYARRQELMAKPGDRSGYELRSELHRSQRTVALQTAVPTSERCRAVIDSLKETIQVPTLRLNTITRFSPADRSDWLATLEQLPKPLAAEWLATAERFRGVTSELGNQMADWSLALVGEMHRREVPIGAGTDTPIGQAIPGYSLHTELERIVEAGLSPMEALRSATIRPAEFLGLSDCMGQIQPGMEADLVLLERNPLSDITNTRSVAVVISDGIRVR